MDPPAKDAFETLIEKIYKWDRNAHANRRIKTHEFYRIGVWINCGKTGNMRFEHMALFALLKFG